MTATQHPALKKLGIIGWDENVRLLLEHLSEGHRYPRKHVELVAWSPLTDNPGIAEFEATRQQRWQAVLEQKDIDLVFLGANTANNANLIEAVAASGLETISFLPFALAESSQSSSQHLHISSHLRASLAGSQGLELVTTGELGTIIALYMGYRMPSQPMEDSAITLRRSLWEALEYALAVADSPLKRLFYRASTLMDEAQDHMQLMLRFDNHCIASLDILQANGVEPVLDIEITGHEGLLQLRPNIHQVRCTSRESDGEQARLELLDWHMPPVIQLIDAFVSGQSAPLQVTTSLKSEFVRLLERLEQSLQGAAEGVITF